MVGFQHRVSNGKNPWAFHPFAGESGPKKSVFLHGVASMKIIISCVV
jgi:nickel-dependent lactate racemase